MNFGVTHVLDLKPAVRAGPPNPGLKNARHAEIGAVLAGTCIVAGSWQLAYLQEHFYEYYLTWFVVLNSCELANSYQPTWSSYVE